MAIYSVAILTNQGANLLADSVANGFKIEFVKMVVGSGIYTDDEKTVSALREQKTLKDKQQEFGFSNIKATSDNEILLKSVISNENLEVGYHITELGIVAKKSGEASEEILYSLAVADEADFLPSKDSPTEIIQEYYTKITNAENVVINVNQGAYATAEDMQSVLFPQYEETAELEELKSGEGIFKAFGKISKAISDLISHIGNKSNPHGVTKTQVGLGNVPNVATNDQTLTYTAATTLTALTSGEKLSVAFEKISKAVSDLISHISLTATTSVLGHVKFGATAGTACQGNDSRLSNARTPTSHASTATTYGAGSTSNYGHVKLTASSAVTDTTGLALAATEKNASIEGTLAYKIAEQNTNLALHSHAWSAITGKPSTFLPSSHTHDDRYYTKQQIDTVQSIDIISANTQITVLRHQCYYCGHIVYFAADINITQDISANYDLIYAPVNSVGGCCVIKNTYYPQCINNKNGFIYSHSNGFKVASQEELSTGYYSIIGFVLAN